MCLITEMYHSALNVGNMLLLIMSIRDRDIRFSTELLLVLYL